MAILLGRELTRKLNPFDVRFRGRGIFEWPVPLSGVEYKNPVMEWVLAAKWSGYRYFDDWQGLEKEQRELLIAAYRIDSQASAVSQKYRKKPRGK